MTNRSYDYDRPDDDIIDEDRIGRKKFHPDDKAIISLLMGGLSVFLALFHFSGPMAIILGAIAVFLAQEVRRRDRHNVYANWGRLLGLIGLVLGTIFFVTCISCISCVGCGRHFYYDQIPFLHRY